MYTDRRHQKMEKKYNTKRGDRTKKELNSPEWLHHRGITRVTRGLSAANELEPQFLFGNTCEDISFLAFPLARLDFIPAPRFLATLLPQPS